MSGNVLSYSQFTGGTTSSRDQDAAKPYNTHGIQAVFCPKCQLCGGREIGYLNSTLYKRETEQLEKKKKKANGRI